MAIAASKLFALNLVEVEPDFHQGKVLPTGDSHSRLALLENELANIKQSITPPGTNAVSSPERSASDDDEDSLLDDLPTVRPKDASSAAPKTKKKKLTEEEEKDPKVKLTHKIMDIIQDYGQNEKNDDHDLWLGRETFEPIVRSHIDKESPIPMILPAFPWKSVNKVEKVTGALPDLGEELGLGRLNSLCSDIKDIYEPGATVLITSDGLVYNDLLGISDEETYEYGACLRRMAQDLGFEHVKFTRIMNLLGLTENADVSKEEYLETVGRTREIMVEKYTPEGFDCHEAVQDDEDINMTYCGYIRFLSKDMKHSPVTAEADTNGEYKRIVKRVAADMITRGKAFAALLEDLKPNHVRLSIHPSTGRKKLSFPLIPQKDHFSMTPWHCSTCVSSKGEFRTAHAQAVRNHYDLIEKNGRPYYFRDRSEVWNWDGVEFDYFYPAGVKVVAKDGKRLDKEGQEKLRVLGKSFRTVIALGFSV